MSTWYTTREVVKTATDSKSTARDNAQVDRAVTAASGAIRGLTHREFMPEQATRTFDWPGDNRTTYRLWLDASDVITVDSITVDGTELDPGSWYLYPDTGPPYTSIQLDRDGSASWVSGQRSIEITGLWGYGDDETPAGALTAGVDASTGTIGVSDASQVGVGSLLHVNAERMLVTARGLADTGATLTAGLDARENAELVAITGTVHAGETITVGTERMLVVDVAGSNLIVDRAWDGSTLAAHDSGASVYAARALTVERAARGTTAAAHETSDTVHVWAPPPLVAAYATGYAITQIETERAGYARDVGTGDHQRETAGRGLRALAALEQQVYRAYGRKARMRTV